MDITDSSLSVSATRTSLLKAFIMLLAMVLAAWAAVFLKPTQKIAEQQERIDLETMIPKQFGDWHEEAQLSDQIINPQLKEKLAKIYTQTLSRTYINDKGGRIMLSIAYGEDQRDSNGLHYPEVCYPAQGFQVISIQPGLLSTDFGDIRVKRLLTVMGNRSEPLTYWTTVGNQVVRGSKETKFEQLRYGLRGQIPDGLLFRVSSIQTDEVMAYAVQQKFINELLTVIDEHSRISLIGKPSLL